MKRKLNRKIVTTDSRQRISLNGLTQGGRRYIATLNPTDQTILLTPWEDDDSTSDVPTVKAD